VGGPRREATYTGWLLLGGDKASQQADIGNAQKHRLDDLEAIDRGTSK
jgi:hypothetical protein